MSDTFDDEQQIVGLALILPETIAPIVDAAGLTGADFGDPGLSLLWDDLREAAYAGRPVDPTSVARRNRSKLHQAWDVPADRVDDVVMDLSSRARPGGPDSLIAAAKRVREAARRRRLHTEANRILHLAGSIDVDPGQLASEMADAGMRELAQGRASQGSSDFRQLGLAAYRDVSRTKAMRDQGLPVGVEFGITVLDRHLHGLRGGEVLICGGEPGGGKTAFWMSAAMKFARKQGRLDPDKRIGTLIESLEMSEIQTAHRYASMLSGIDGSKLRSGRVSQDDIDKMVRDFRAQTNLPLRMNYGGGGVKASQLRARVAQAVHEDNVGLVVIDHFRQFDMDNPSRNELQDDEDRIRFLKERIAQDFDVAVVVLAHTRKTSSDTGGGPAPRPKLSDLRGSGQIGAIVDFVTFLHRPYGHLENSAPEDRGDVTDAQLQEIELIYGKNRFGARGVESFQFIAERMAVLAH